MVVPTGAVRESPDGDHVLKVVDGVVQIAAVTLGDRDTERGLVEILSGVAEGDTVVVAPGELQDGTNVRIDAAAPPSDGGDR